jgi:hypothetical protein
VSNEIIMERRQISELVDALTEMLKVESHYQFKMRFDNDGTITIIPHAQPVVIKSI